jgi:hypothetical protein
VHAFGRPFGSFEEARDFLEDLRPLVVFPPRGLDKQEQFLDQMFRLPTVGSKFYCSVSLHHLIDRIVSRENSYVSFRCNK